MYDLVIIGASAAGISAAIYAARRQLDFLIVTNDIGGEVSLSGEVNNWPGIISISGFELAQNFRRHLEHHQVKTETGFFVSEVKPEKNHHLVLAKNDAGEEKTYQAKAVIIASGIHPRLLNIPGEKELRGKGVTYCTVCDGPLFKNKITATVGAGNSALESALMMSGIAKKVFLLTRYPDNPKNRGGFPKGESILIDKVKKAKNIEILYQADSKEILGDGLLSGLKYLDLTNQEEKQIAVQGVMVHIGMIPNSDFINCVNKNPAGEIEVDLKGATSCPGIFAAGDVTNIPHKQIAIAAGQGVTAALSAIDYLNKWQDE